jgi:energy-coupling factor transporter ATP-binding protein EcfA2
MEDYPPDYRAHEIQHILRAICAGECAAIIGMSGSGKSNLLSCLLKQAGQSPSCPPLALVDCNRLSRPGPEAFFRLIQNALTAFQPAEDISTFKGDDLAALDERIGHLLSSGRSLCLLLDRFDALFDVDSFWVIASNLRALRDAHKYRLTYVTAARCPLDPHTELAELFFGHTLWIGPLAHGDALWSARRDAALFASFGQREWSPLVLEKLVELSWGYPSLLRAACEAYADGANLTSAELGAHPAVQRRAAELLASVPATSQADALRKSGLQGHPWLRGVPAGEMAVPVFDTSQLTAKEHLLLKYLIAHPGQVCEKDDLVRAVWPEDVIYEQGVRDESLAQLVRRLRVKIELNPNDPVYIQTIPGRGYLFRV